MEKILEIHDLVKRKGRKEILHHVSFEIKRGEIVGFLGANGAGKTTTLKCILGLYRYEGTINLNGENILHNHERTGNTISGLIEEPCFYPNITGMQNIKIHRDYYGKIQEEHINKIVATLHMEDFINRKVKSYSLGMKQKLGLALSLVNDPALILLDEPMNGLDPDGIKDLRELLIKLAHENQKAVLVSSHILSEMQMLCDRVIFINAGSIVSEEKVSANLEAQYMSVMRGE